MRGAALIGLAFLAALALAGSAQAVNPIPNPGFETPAGDPCNTPAQWSPLGGIFGCPAPILRDTVVVHSGAASMKVQVTATTTDTPDISDCFSLAAGSYNTSYFYFTDQGSVSGAKFLVQYYADPTGCKGAPATQALNVSTSQGAWHLVSGVLSFPTGTYFGQIQVGCTCAAGTINFDDLSLDALPTAVSVTGFRAERTLRGVVLRWRTASEVGTLGFNVYRERPGGPRVRVNQGLIAARGSGAGGAAYRVTDRRTPSGTVRYWLEAVDRSGSRTWRGPAAAR